MTLFHFYQEQGNSKDSVSKVLKLAQTDDAVLVLGHSSINIFEIIAYFDVLKALKSSTESTTASPVSLHWYVLETDIMALTATAQTAFKNNVHACDKKISIINGEEWLSLTLIADRVVTLC